jgi:hypothetical protein
VIGRAGRNAGGPPPVGTKTPSVAHAWRCTARESRKGYEISGG